jgi:hypothetical protein
MWALTAFDKQGIVGKAESFVQDTIADRPVFFR